MHVHINRVAVAVNDWIEIYWTLVYTSIRISYKSAWKMCLCEVCCKLRVWIMMNQNTSYLASRINFRSPWFCAVLCVLITTANERHTLEYSIRTNETFRQQASTQKRETHKNEHEQMRKSEYVSKRAKYEQQTTLYFARCCICIVYGSRVQWALAHPDDIWYRLRAFFIFHSFIIMIIFFVSLNFNKLSIEAIALVWVWASANCLTQSGKNERWRSTEDCKWFRE